MSWIAPLETDRLTLRPFRPEDAETVAALLSDPRMDGHGLKITQPFPVELARSQIAGHRAKWEARDALWLAVCEREGPLLGSIEMSLDGARTTGGLGYWLSPDHWGRGYMTEALRAVVALALGELQLQGVKATCLASNAASRRVLEKLGMRATPGDAGTVRYSLERG